MTFPNIPCAILSLDIVDVTGVHMVNLDGRIHKHSLNKDGSKLKTTDAVSILDYKKLMELDCCQAQREGLELYCETNAARASCRRRLRN